MREDDGMEGSIVKDDERKTEWQGGWREDWIETGCAGKERSTVREDGRKDRSEGSWREGSNIRQDGGKENRS